MDVGRGACERSRGRQQENKKIQQMELTFANLMIKTCACRRDGKKLRSRPANFILNSWLRMARSPRHHCVNFLSFANSRRALGFAMLHLLEIKINYRDGLVNFDYKTPRH